MSKVVILGIGKIKGDTLTEMESGHAVKGKGLLNDRKFKDKNDIKSQLTLIEVENINTYIVQLNGVPVTLPYDVKYGDVLTITINKTIVTNSAYMTLKGKLK